jgi:hypothetical protein
MMRIYVFIIFSWPDPKLLAGTGFSCFNMHATSGKCFCHALLSSAEILRG